MITRLKPKSEFSSNILTLMTGATIAQAIPVAISPILSRIYTPEDFGVLALFGAVTVILGSVASGRYELAIMLPKKDEDAINIFALGFIITTVLSLFLLVLVIVFNDDFTNLLGNEEISPWLYFVPLTVFFTGFWNILNYFNNRGKNYRDLRDATILKSIVLAAIQLAVGFFKSGVTGLISGQIISQLFANTRLLKNIIKNKFLVSKISKVKIIALAKRYKDFPIHNTPAALADTAALQAPLILIPKIFGLAVSGHFVLAKRIISLPSGIIANSMSQVFFQVMSDKKNKKIKCMPFLLATIVKLSLIAFPIALLIMFSGPYVFGLVFGDNWKISGEIAQYLAFVFFITFIVSATSSVFSVSGFIKRGAMWKYLYLVSSLIFFAIVYSSKADFFDFLLYFVIHEYVLYLLYLYLIVKSVRQMDEGI